MCADLLVVMDVVVFAIMGIIVFHTVYHDCSPFLGFFFFCDLYRHHLLLGLRRESCWIQSSLSPLWTHKRDGVRAFFFCGCLITINVKCVFIFTGKEIMTGPNSIVTPTLINSHRASSMAPFFHCENPASWCMNGGKKKKKRTHK